MVERLGLSFHNVRALHSKIDQLPERAGRWVVQELFFDDRPDETFTIRYRNPVDAIRTLWKDPVNGPDIVYRPHKLFRDAKEDARIFSEMWTGRWWNMIQVRSCLIFDSSGLIFLSGCSPTKVNRSAGHHRHGQDTADPVLRGQSRLSHIPHVGKLSQECSPETIPTCLHPHRLPIR